MSTKKSVGVWIAIGCGAILVAGVAFVAFVVVIVFGAMRSSQPYQDAIRTARSDPRVSAAIGSPIEPGLFVSGEIHTENDAGKVEISVPIKGPKGSGSVYVVGTKTGGRWSYTTMTFTPKAGPAIDLLTPRRTTTRGG